MSGKFVCTDCGNSNLPDDNMMACEICEDDLCFYCAGEFGGWCYDCYYPEHYWLKLFFEQLELKQKQGEFFVLMG